MKLKAKDQVSISAVQPDSLRPGQVFEVSDALGDELIKKRPDLFEQVASADPGPDPAPQPKDDGEGEKAEPAPANKAEPKPANKAGKAGGKSK